MGIGIRKFFVAVFLLIVVNLANAREYVDHMVGVYFHENSLAFLEHNLDQVLEINGFSSTDYAHSELIKKIPLTKFDDFFQDNEKIKTAARSIRRNFVKFLEGISIKDRHEFEISAKGIEATVDWEKFGVKLAPSTYEHFAGHNEILVEAHLKARRLRLFINEVRLKDEQHKFLGTLGGNGFFVELDRTKGSELNIVLPARVSLLDNGGVRITVEPPRHNLAQIVLAAGWNPPLLLPKVEIRINGRRAYLRLDEIENIIRGQIPKITEGLKEMAQEFMQNELAPLLTEKINAITTKGHTEINEMDPVGVPDGKVDIKYRWGLQVGQLDFVGKNLHIGLKGFIEDPKLQNDIPLIDGQMARTNPMAQSFDREQYDVAITLNQAFVNRLLQYSTNRGYFRSMEMDKGGTPLQLVRQPFINFVGRVNGKAPTMNIKTKYSISGWKKIFVRNPMQVEADLLLAFTKNAEGKLQIVIDGIDFENARLEDKYIKIFKKKVRKEMKSTLKAMGAQIKGQVIAEALPLPTDLAGIPMELLKTKIDPMGHLILFMDLKI
jgi:hypothetical protein